MGPQRCVPSGGRSGESAPLLSLASRGAHIPWLVDPSSACKASRLCDTPTPPSYGDLVMTQVCPCSLG